MTQKEQILSLLSDGNWHSNGEMALSLHILRYAARIWELKREGHEIEERNSGSKWEWRVRPKEYVQIDFITPPPASEPPLVR